MSKEITELTVDVYRGNLNRRETHERPSWDAVECAVRSLNGGHRSSMCLENVDDDVLAIGGGEDLFHVSIVVGSRTFVLTDGTGDMQPVEVIVGAVETPLPASYLVDVDAALHAAQAFWNGILDPHADLWIEV